MPTHKRILVADRNRRFLTEAERILAEDANVECICLEGGERVFGVCETERPDGALLGAELPLAAGTEVCQRLKHSMPQLPVVLMFHEGSEDCAAVSKKHGADNYLLRPIKRKELLYSVREMLRLGHLFGERSASDVLTGDAESSEWTSGEEGGATVSLEVFHRFLRLEILRSDRYGFPLGVLSVATDPLPSDVPETWALSLEKQMGEALAATIRAEVRSIDLSAALSMREMLVLMPHTDAEGAHAAANRIRAAVASQPYHFGRKRIQPTVSIGIGIVHGERMPVPQVLSAAQSRRMQAAHAGGNQVLI
jgi:diguanylate cyclase (GGDEF)-like protein